MRGYDREEVEDYDDYDMEGEYQDDDVAEEYGEEYEEEEEEEETRKPTQEELEYLELRQRLKDNIRRKRKQSALTSSQEKKLPYNNFGSFFGPSQPLISKRVIQESKSLLENQNMVSKLLSSNQSNKKNPASNSAGPKQAQHCQALKPPSELRRKVEKLKVARDYSFLSDDTGVPATAKDPPPRNVSAPTSEARSAQKLLKSREPLSSNNNSGRHLQGTRDERKSVLLKGQLQSKFGTNKSSSACKPNGMPMDSKKQLGVSSGMGPGRPGSVSNGTGSGRPVSNGTGPGRPVSNGTGPGRSVGASNGTGPGRSVGASNGTAPGRPAGPKAVPSKMPITKMEKKISAPTSRNVPPSAHKAPPSKVHTSDSRRHLEQKRGSQERSKDKMMSQRPPVSSKPQANKPVKQVLSHSQMKSNVQRPKKKNTSDDERALMMVRTMFRTDRWAACDDVDDVSDMEANWDEIRAEERRSAKIAKEEDAEQLRLIEEEERRERMAKKRKLSRH
ncbi:hypothetical protein like AT2G22720 [Hibiscus trionum]|uniref:SPT2 chromatin protein n=1 Tax=Hibiscus trionum TaxID=183268 RepID=A0A9W7HZK9_HIBTR|nr:hypothetical protein like AT2G22720 [Hibiscus trionum]